MLGNWDSNIYLWIPHHQQSNNFIKLYIRTLKNSLTKAKAPRIFIPWLLIKLQLKTIPDNLSNPAKMLPNRQISPKVQRLLLKHPLTLKQCAWLFSTVKGTEKSIQQNEDGTDLFNGQDFLNRTVDGKWLPAKVTLMALYVAMWWQTSGSSYCWNRRKLKDLFYTFTRQPAPAQYF